MDLPQTPAEALVPAPTAANLGLAPRDALSRLQQMEFRAVQLSATWAGMRPRDLDQSARRDLLATLGRRELALAGLDCWIPAEHLLDPVRADRAVAAVTAAIELAGALGRCPVCLALPEEDPPDAALLEQVCAAAERHGVVLADHRLRPSPEERIALGVDPATWLAAGEDPAAGVARYASRLGSARLVDLHRTGLRGPVGSPHEGRLDVQAYRVALSVAGYRGPVVLDTRQWVDPLAGIVQSRDAWARAAV